VEIEYGDAQDIIVWSVNVLGATEDFSDSNIEEAAGTQEFDLSGFAFPASVKPRFVTINGTSSSLISGSSDLLARVKITIVLE
jgi:hypothetical protein